jgi:hypothetical protein
LLPQVDGVVADVETLAPHRKLRARVAARHPGGGGIDIAPSSTASA